jgi:hypothetical protein
MTVEHRVINALFFFFYHIDSVRKNPYTEK